MIKYFLEIKIRNEFGGWSSINFYFLPKPCLYVFFTAFNFFLHFFFQVCQFRNSEPVIAEGGTKFELLCNLNDTTNINLQWIRSLNKTINQPFFVEPDSSINITDDGKLLVFNKIGVLDEEYYACIYRNTTTNRFVVVKSYEIFIRGKFYKA